MTRTKKSEPLIDEKVVSSRLIYDGRMVRLRRNEVRLPDGRMAVREIIEHPGSVGIIPLLDDEKLIVIRQYRLATGGLMVEIPAGTMEKGETPVECARRELEEETGYKAGTIEPLFSCYLTPGYSTEVMHFFVAKSLVKTKQATDEDEIIAVDEVRPKEALRMIRTGKIKDAKSIAALLYLQATGRFAKKAS